MPIHRYTYCVRDADDMWYLSLLQRMPPHTHCTSPPSPSRRPCVGSPLTGAHVMILETTHQYGDALAWRRVGVPTQILPGDKADPCLATQKCRPEVTTSYAEKVTGTSGRKWYHALVLNRIVATASGGRWLTQSPPPFEPVLRTCFWYQNIDFLITKLL